MSKTSGLEPQHTRNQTWNIINIYPVLLLFRSIGKKEIYNDGIEGMWMTTVPEEAWST